MELSDLNFLFRFLPVFLVLYILCPTKYRNGVLFGFSLLFCGLNGVEGAAVLLCSLTVNYAALCLMEVSRKPARRKACLSLAILFNTGLLGYYKYAAETLPIGISFYTFTLLSADIDVFLRRERAPRNWMELGTYTAMFPRLLSGPITEYHTSIRQLRHRDTNGKKVEYGLSLVIAGLSLKVIIADTMGILWHYIQTVGFESISTPLAWMGAAAYSMQLFFDFQGYSLMAVGLGHMLGFDLPHNFDHPYRSRSISEYYRRWHISDRKSVV